MNPSRADRHRPGRHQPGGHPAPHAQPPAVVDERRVPRTRNTHRPRRRPWLRRTSRSVARCSGSSSQAEVAERSRPRTTRCSRKRLAEGRVVDLTGDVAADADLVEEMAADADAAEPLTPPPTSDEPIAAAGRRRRALRPRPTPPDRGRADRATAA